MRPYNVEFFSQNFALKHHTNIDSVTYDYDYLSPKTNKIVVRFSTEYATGDYVRIYRDTESYFGRVKGITIVNTAGTAGSVEYEPFERLFSTEIMFDVTQQGTKTIEQTLADTITAWWIQNSDTAQNVPGLNVTTTTSTAWDFQLQPSVEGLNYRTINLYNELIVPAMSRLGVGVYVEPDPYNQQIDITIGKAAAQAYTVEANLPNVIVSNIVLNETSEDANKLIVYDATDLVSTITYYKHPDRSYDTQDTDRIVPVIYKISTVTPNEDDTFADLAQREAAKLFESASYNNLIELTVLNDDALVGARTMQIGQTVNIVSDGVSYPSILTGREINKVTKLIFGNIRIDLTTILKQRSGGNA